MKKKFGLRKELAVVIMFFVCILMAVYGLKTMGLIEDDYGNEDSRELWDLDYGDAFDVGCAFKANMDKILGTTKTYKDMVK